MRFKNRFQRFMNHRAPANGRYKPTCYEHAANCYTHAFLIVPAIVGSALLHRLSDDCWEKITAWIYGMGLCALFIVSTVFHIVSWKKSHLRTVEHCFHMCDRMVIYFFIAASYAPWLNLRELGPLASHMRWFIWLMAAGGTIYVFLYHEKYKVVELFFYLTMGFSPALVVTSMTQPPRLRPATWCLPVLTTHRPSRPHKTQPHSEFHSLRPTLCPPSAQQLLFLSLDALRQPFS
ncbi:monocyte to macrophage differentiation factor isoform X3 [Mustela nigripes]|uniref:Monocyte to macrophage differentiation factor isoform X2 n=1 Tax=Mustela putorius furo TaxID=9669 RepID=A0A8U0NRB7_MUSPF|nr:monocyte to macrophage differentiation factor isoform X2 [Mustela putorius furo]XP_059234873.1 monocyte to macrophage differentiation factor isoform X3 [Mustela nigripes]